MTDSLFTLELLAFLTTSPAQNALNDLAQYPLKPADTLSHVMKLRKHFSAEQASVLLETARLRQKAVPKFGLESAQLLFTADALEQASDPRIRAYRAMQGRGHVLDACCGVGADSLAFARAGCAVTGRDIDAVRVAMAEHNAQALGMTATFEQYDVTDMTDICAYDMLFFDPARRDESGKRLFHVDQYVPPLSTQRAWEVPLVAVKLAPSVVIEQLAEERYSRLEFISVKGDLKEAVLWRENNANTREKRATLITDSGIYHWDETNPDEEDVTIHPPEGYLIEPDASLLRVGAVQALATRLNAYQLDETIAYLTAPEMPNTVWARSWKIVAWMPFQLKRLKAYLRAHHMGQVTVKKRGFAMLPEELLAQLKPKGENACTLVMTRLRGEPIAIVCE